MQGEYQSTKWYRKPVVVYILSIIFFPVGLYLLWTHKTIGKGTKILVTGIVAIYLIINFAIRNNNSTEKVETKASSEQKAGNWVSFTKVDQMTNQTKFFTSLESENEVDFDFPHNGGSRLKMTVRNIGEGDEVVISVSKGQMMTSITGNDYPILVKFDENKPIEYYHNSSATGLNEVLFLQGADSFIEQLKKSKKVKIRVLFFNEGNRDFDFNVQGFKWPIK